MDFRYDDPGENPRISHSPTIALLDPNGALRGVLRPGFETHSAPGELELLRVNGQPALVRLAGDDSDMIFTVRLNPRGEICWLHTLRNPKKLAVVKALHQRP